MGFWMILGRFIMCLEFDNGLAMNISIPQGNLMNRFCMQLLIILFGKMFDSLFNESGESVFQSCILWGIRKRIPT
jgi:hypothetical protein